jgi:FKBP-type peptidyl-prolyl cis-trans isomerase (trigger factor)
MPTKKVKNTHKNTPSIARQDDGTVQINFVIPWNKIAKERQKTVKELALNVEVPGFRRGKAPINKAEEKLDKQYVLEHTLSHILPKLFADTVKEQKLRPAMYPKFELISAQEDKDWQVKATTAEFPEFQLGDYKKIVKDSKSTDIWTPDKGMPAEAGDPNKHSEPTREQKENMAISALGEHYKFAIPKILIEEEVNSRLSSLLERIEKLGLSLESYLASVKKTAEELREEYGASAERAIRLDIVFGAIAEAESINVSAKEVDAFVNAARASSQSIPDDHKSTVSSFLIKRKVLEKLASMV